jgi:hypothetical protein
MVHFDSRGWAISSRSDGPFAIGRFYRQRAQFTEMIKEVNQLTSFLALTQARLMDAVAQLRNREEGQGLTEYVVLLGGVVAMVIALVAILTTNLTTYITDLISGLPTP